MSHLRSFRLGNLSVVLNRDLVVPDDPGESTPAMVYHESKQGRSSATYWFVIGEGHLHPDNPRFRRTHDYVLSETQMEWLQGLQDKIEEFLYKDKQ